MYCAGRVYSPSYVYRNLIAYQRKQPCEWQLKAKWLSKNLDSPYPMENYP